MPKACFAVPAQDIPGPRLIAKTQHYAEIPRLLAAGADEILYLPQDFREAGLNALLDSPWLEKARLCLPGLWIV